VSTYDRLQAHPGYGLTNQRIWQTYRNAECGWVQPQCDLFDDIKESDGHLLSLYNGRLEAVAGKEWVIQAGGTDAASKAAAEALAEQLDDDENFVEFMEHQLSAEFYGFAASEMAWGFSERERIWAPERFINVPHRRFSVNNGSKLMLLTDESRFDGIPLEVARWVVSRGRHANIARAGLLRTATWWAHFKRLSVRDWVIFAAKFGIPHVTGVYQENASEEAQSALKTAVEDIGEGGQAILAETTRIVLSELAQRSGDTSSVHPSIIAMCEAQMSKLINGATLNVETGGPGSFALGKVHQTRAHVKDVSAALRMSRVFRSQVSGPFCHFNGFLAAGAKAPRLKIQVVQELDQATRLMLASMMANELGADIDEAQLRDELGLRKPSDEANTLRGTKNSTDEDPTKEESDPDASSE
jgi:phage gp29-like protein